MAKQRGLGRGLSALIGETGGSDGLGLDGRRQEVAVAEIVASPFQPRREFDGEGLRDLAESIKLHGIIQPVVVRQVPEGFQLVVGERRVRAAKLAGLERVPVVVRTLTDRQVMEIALVENLQRSDLNPMEECLAYRRLIEEFAWTQEEIGARVGRSRSHIANYLRLLQLSDVVQGMITRQLLSVAHAKVLLSVDEEKRDAVAERAVREGWTVRQLQSFLDRGESAPSRRVEKDVHVRAVETELRRRFGTKVTVRGDANKGRIEIPYKSLDEFERVLGMLEDTDSRTDGFVV